MILLQNYCSDKIFILNKKAEPKFRFTSDPDWIQTNDPKLRRFVLYSAELPDHLSKILLKGGKDKFFKVAAKA